MGLVSVELSAGEVRVLAALVEARAAEFERMMQNMEEQEGMDLQRHNLLKQMRPQLEVLQDLVVKLGIASKEAAGG